MAQWSERGPSSQHHPSWLCLRTASVFCLCSGPSHTWSAHPGSTANSTPASLPRLLPTSIWPPRPARVEGNSWGLSASRLRLPPNGLRTRPEVGALGRFPHAPIPHPGTTGNPSARRIPPARQSRPPPPSSPALQQPINIPWSQRGRKRTFQRASWRWPTFPPFPFLPRSEPCLQKPGRESAPLHHAAVGRMRVRIPGEGPGTLALRVRWARAAEATTPTTGICRRAPHSTQGSGKASWRYLS